MKVLIVHAHPEPKSFCGALKETAVKYYKERGDNVEISDLYAMNFNPIGGKHDFLDLPEREFFKYQLEQVNAYNTNLFVDELKREMDKILRADLIIFNFPLWWFSVPAILKGWVNRVFAMGFAYGAGKGVYDKGTFKGKKAFCTLTTGGPETSYGPDSRNGDLNTILYHINHGMFYFVGMKVLPQFVVFGPARLSGDDRKAILEKYNMHLVNLDSYEPLF